MVLINRFIMAIRAKLTSMSVQTRILIMPRTAVLRRRCVSIQMEVSVVRVRQHQIRLTTGLTFLGVCTVSTETLQVFGATAGVIVPTDLVETTAISVLLLN